MTEEMSDENLLPPVHFLTVLVCVVVESLFQAKQYFVSPPIAVLMSLHYFKLVKCAQNVPDVLHE